MAAWCGMYLPLKKNHVVYLSPGLMREAKSSSNNYHKQ